MRVRVPVATLWVEPNRPREVDAPALTDPPDLGAWLTGLDAHTVDDESGDGRRGLKGRVVTQLLAGEPVLALGEGDNTAAGWVDVVCPWQPSSLDERGYPGWLLADHLEPDDSDDEPWPRRRLPLDMRSDGDERTDLQLARRYLGLPYLWGGMSPLGLDCSGLVHLVQRTLGAVVPRDAHDQQAVCDPVDPDEAQPGDLFFFAEPGEEASHVGIVTGAYRMVHASGDLGIVDEPLTPERRATLSGAGRLRPDARR